MACLWVERPKLHQGFVKGHKRELSEEIRKKKTPKLKHTRQGSCQLRALKPLQKEEVEQEPKISSLSLKPPPVLKTWRVTDCTALQEQLYVSPNHAGSAIVGRLADLDAALGQGKIGSNGLPENLLITFLTINFDKSFSHLLGLRCRSGCVILPIPARSHPCQEHPAADSGGLSDLPLQQL